MEEKGIEEKKRKKKQKRNKEKTERGGGGAKGGMKKERRGKDGTWQGVLIRGSCQTRTRPVWLVQTRVWIRACGRELGC